MLTETNATSTPVHTCTCRSYTVVNRDEADGGEEEGYWLLRTLDGAASGLVPRNHLEELRVEKNDRGATIDDAETAGVPRGASVERATATSSSVRVLLFTVTVYANDAHNLTRSP